MGQHDRTRRFPAQTAAIPTSIQRDSRSRTSHARPDRRRPQRIKRIRNFDRQPLENLDHRQIECDMRVILLLVDNEGRRTKLSIRPADKRNPQISRIGRRTKGVRNPRSLGRREYTAHRRAGRPRRRSDIKITMPTATPASAPSAAERRRGLKPSKKTKGNDGASKGGATTGADKSRAPKGKGTGRSPSLRNA